MTESNSIGAYEAKSHFSEMLRRVALGEDFTITRHGVPVARLIPVQVVSTEDDRKRAIQTMREIASRNRLDGLQVKDLLVERRK